MNVSERLAEDMLRIEPANARYLTRGEMDAYGLTERDPVYQETLDLDEARRLGLDRGEFTRRKLRTERECPPVNASILDWRRCYDRIMAGR